MMLIPEAWAGNPLMDAKRRAFYEYHACLMEPWDGPAAMAFTDGRQIGATLDRNGLRPARYFVTDEGLVVMASETGVLPFPEKSIVQKWRQPGKMLLIDLEKGRIRRGDQGRARRRAPYQQWLDRTQIRVHEPGLVLAAAAHQCEPARSPAGVRLHAGERQVPDGADGADWPGGRRLQAPTRRSLRCPTGRSCCAFQAELRASDQSADRPDPRGAGHVARDLHRAAAEPARPRRHVQAEAAQPNIRSSPTRTWSASAASATSPTISSAPSRST